MALGVFANLIVESQNWEDQEKAAIGLAAAGPRAVRFVVPALSRAQGTSYDKLVAVLGAAGKGDVPALVEAMRTGDEKTRIGAARALGIIGGPAAVEALGRAAANDKSPAAAAEAAKALRAARDKEEAARARG